MSQQGPCAELSSGVSWEIVGGALDGETIEFSGEELQIASRLAADYVIPVLGDSSLAMVSIIPAKCEHKACESVRRCLAWKFISQTERDKRDEGYPIYVMETEAPHRCVLYSILKWERLDK